MTTLTPKLIELVTELRGRSSRLELPAPTVDDVMKLVIELRADARKKKDFATADKIRHALTALKIVLEDRPGGTEWAGGQLEGRRRSQEALEAGELGRNSGSPTSSCAPSSYPFFP